MSEVWAKWEGQVINGVFPLRQFLGGSDHSGVFVSEFKAGNRPIAALKLVPAIPTLTEAQLSHWTATAALSHPHLARILETGRCELGGLQFLFVVMEYAEQTLSQILPQRALTVDEVRTLLLPVLAALGFLHRQNLVQGQLKPANILVVDDQLKIASDTIRPAGDSTASIAQPSVYDPPEAGDGVFSAAGDIWSLGVTIVEALTQLPPVWQEGRFNIASLPATLPPVFVSIVKQCLSRTPANRPTVADLEAKLRSVSQAPGFAAPQPAPAPAERSPKWRWAAATLAVALMVVLAIWVGLRSSSTSQNSQVPRSALPEVSVRSLGQKSADSELATSTVVSGPSDQPAQPLANGSPSVLHQEIPAAPRSALDTIHGRIKVAVRVTIDSSGNVIDAALENPGPSRYFARLATGAARKWKFAPADDKDSRQRLLRFEFTRDGATGRAATPQS